MAPLATARLCSSCQEQVIFINEAFGCVCSQCGTVVEEVNFIWDNSAVHFRSTPSVSYSSRPLGRVEKQAKRALGNLHLNGPKTSDPITTPIVAGILAKFHRESLHREVHDLIFQIKTLSTDLNRSQKEKKEKGKTVIKEDTPVSEELDTEEGSVVQKVLHLEGEKGSQRLAVAATFAVLKRYDTNLTLEDVCQVAPLVSLEHVATSLRYMESLLGGTALLATSRDEPSAYIASQISFLSQQSNLKVRDRSESPNSPNSEGSVLGIEEQMFVRQASIDSSAFHELVIDLCSMCSNHGLNNRSTKLKSRKDLAICAWAILMLAMEASSGRICNEGKLSKVMLSFNSWIEGNADVVLGDIILQKARSTQEEIVKKRYVEISRMLTLYLERLPWLYDELPQSKEKKAKKSRGRKEISRVKEDVSSIKPFPRKVVAKYLPDVIKLRRFIEKEFKEEDLEWKDQAALQWTRFGSTEDFFHPIRASAEGQRRIKEEEVLGRSRSAELDASEQRTGLLEQSGVLDAVDDMLERDDPEGSKDNGLSQLSKLIGPSLLQLRSLEDISDGVIDSLLFEDGEMESYLRSQEEIEAVKALRLDSGDWDAPSSSYKVKRARTKDDDLFIEIKVNGKRTKALSESDEARLLSSLI